MSGTLSERSSKIYNILTGKVQKREKYRLFDWEPLIDSFLAFYDTCCTLESQKRDKQVANFVKKFRPSIEELRNLRVNKNDFDVIKTIGRGHFGEVYVVKEKGSQDIYAMKILKKSATLSNDNVAFYEEERDIMAFANSQWVTSLQYAFQDTENLYLVMEFLPGGDLLNLISRYTDGVMDEDDARFYLAEIILSVHAVHIIGYVHRDVKPENILIDMTGHVKLADFGSSAKLINETKVLCKMPVGTPEYIAPEVLQSMNSGGGLYGCECDWWSVGVVCYEMLCGTLPFEADGVLQLYSQIMNFKNSLCFPDDITISETSRSLIVGLLDDQKSRMGYNALAQHDFFKSIDWTTLKSVNPPYIPELKDPLDTSHFSDFRSSKLNAGKPIEPSFGNTIPFIGFTFTRNFFVLCNEASKAKTPGISQLGVSMDDEKVKDISVQKPPMDIEVSEAMTKTISDLQKRCKKLETDLAASIDQCKSKTESITTLNVELTALSLESFKMKTQLEDNLRDSESIQALKDHAENMMNSLEMEKNKNAGLHNEMEALKALLDAVSGELDLSTKKLRDSESYWKEFENIQLKTIDELKSSVEELQQLLDKTNIEYSEKMKITLDEVKKYRVSFETMEKKVNLIEDEKRENNQNIDIDELNQLKTRLEETSVRFEELQKRYHDVDDLGGKKDVELKAREIVELKLNQNIRTLENQLQQANSRVADNENNNIDNMKQIAHLKTLNVTLNNEKVQLKTDCEKKAEKINELSERLKNNTSIYRYEKIKTEDRLLQLLQDIEALNSRLTMTKIENAKLEAKINEPDSSIALLNSELSRLEAENSRLSLIISTQKNSNFSLSQQLEDVNARIYSLESENEQNNAKIIEINESYKQQIYKLDSTIAQQNKLINFLHTDSSKKKSGKFSKTSVDSFAKKPSVSPVPSRKMRDAEQQLEVERMQSLRLNNELIRLREELNILKSAQTKLFRKSSINGLNFVRQDSVNDESLSIEGASTEQFQNKQEHILCASICTIPNICFVCLTPIAFCKSTIQCMSCKSTCHLRCQNNFPVFSCTTIQALLNVALMIDCNFLPKIYSDLDSFKITLPFIGYLSVPHQVGYNKYDWEKRQFELTSSKLILRSIKDLDHPKIMGEINFKNMITSCSIRAAVHTSDIFFTPVTNAPYVFGLEIAASESSNFDLRMNCIDNHETCPKNQNTILYMLAQSMEEKRLWVRLLCNTISEKPSIVSKSINEPLTTLNTSAFPNISVIVPLLDDLLLIGCDWGVILFQFSDNTSVNCLSEKQQCYGLYLCEKSLFGIVGYNRHLVRFKHEKSKNILKISIKKSKLTVLNLGNISDGLVIHLVEQRSSNFLIYVSKPGELMCVTIGSNSLVLSIVKISTSENPPTSVLLAENGLMICQDRFYLYNSDKCELREMLDSNDHSLAFLIYGSTPESNYPKNIFKMTRSPQSEYLICYSEFGLIVDQNGKRLSTGDIRWNDIPLSFNYMSDHLFVCYADAIEIRSFKVSSLTDLSEITPTSYLSINCPIVLGQGFNRILVGSVMPDTFSLELYKLTTDMLGPSIIHSDSGSSLKTNESSNVSFTSSKSAKRTNFFSKTKR